jgi:hypothetical protein
MLSGSVIQSHLLQDRGGELDAVFQRRVSSSSTCVRDQNASIGPLP